MLPQFRRWLVPLAMAAAPAAADDAPAAVPPAYMDGARTRRAGARSRAGGGAGRVDAAQVRAARPRESSRAAVPERAAGRACCAGWWRWPSSRAARPAGAELSARMARWAIRRLAVAFARADGAARRSPARASARVTRIRVTVFQKQDLAHRDALSPATAPSISRCWAKWRSRPDARAPARRIAAQLKQRDLLRTRRSTSR